MIEVKNCNKSTIIFGLMWKLFGNFGTQLINFIIQVILERLLIPDDYGIIALTSVFILIANVFINIGFSSAIMQSDEIDQEELSSIFI